MAGAPTPSPMPTDQVSFVPAAGASAPRGGFQVPSWLRGSASGSTEAGNAAGGARPGNDVTGTYISDVLGK